MSGVARSAAGPGEQPVWLASGSEQAFAVLHLPPDAVAHPTAVLVCPPFGWEEESAHRGLANWARGLAAAGHPVLRLDYPGTRNSTGDREARHPDRWKLAIADAAVWLAARTGSPRIALLGIGLGGLVACDALLDGACIDDLILWAVPSTGRKAMRELRIQARVIAARYPEDAAPDQPGAPIDLVGYTLDADAAAAFAQITLTDRPFPGPAPGRALLLGRDGMAIDGRLRTHLEQAGVAVTVRDGPGYALLAGEPLGSRTPEQTIAATIHWLGDQEVPERGGEADLAHPEADDGAAAGASVELRHDGTPIRETALRLPGRAGRLFTIIAEPVEPGASLCVVMLNSGALSHAGPNRMWVQASRRWAALGVPTVRVDFPGIAETEGDGERLVDVHALYEPQWIEETIALLDSLQERRVASRFVLCGLCSGAYWAWHAGLRDDRVVGMVLVNLWSFFFSRELLAERAPGDALGRLRQQGLGRLLRRDVTREKLVQAIRSVRPSRVLAGARRDVEHAQRDDILAALDGCNARGTEIALLFGQGEPLYEQLEREGLLGASDRWPGLSVSTMPTADHMFRALPLQSQLNAALDHALARIRHRAARGPTAPLAAE